MSVTRDAAERAAKWWTDRLREGGGGDAGDAGLNALLSMTAAASRRNPMAEEQIEAFRESLANEIMAALDGTHSDDIFLGVDYDPCPILSAALEAANGEPHRHVPFSAAGILPCKTRMWVHKSGRVEVRAGYGAGPIDI